MATIRVPKVKSVKADIQKSLPPVLLINAIGEVPTTGYTNARLEPYIYVHAPFDGIWDFTFIVDEPTGPVNEVITEVKAGYDWADYPKDLKGVRIHGDNGFVVAYI